MIRTLLEQGYDVMVDGTHTTVPSITRLLEIDPDAQFHFVNTDKNVCIQRARATNQEDLVKVILRHYHNVQQLTDADPVNNLAIAIRRIRHDIKERMEHTKRV